MKSVTHQEQQKIWDEEHTSPQVLLQMDSTDPSSGVVKFWQWLQANDKNEDQLRGIEMGCGKGRNVIWLAQQGVHTTGFDFSPKAIEVAKKRARNAGVADKTGFLVQDATVPWNFPSNSFNFAIDCFATTDIESKEGREFAVSEMIRVVKPGGLILVYVMSTDDEFQKEMIKKSPANEKHAFLHPTGKFEKVFDREELLQLYKGMGLVIEKRVAKKVFFSEKEYDCFHHWMIFEKA